MKLTLDDKELAENPAVKEWLAEVGRRLGSEEDNWACFQDALCYGSSVMRWDGDTLCLVRVDPAEVFK